jgi:hypothetical protein
MRIKSLLTVAASLLVAAGIVALATKGWHCLLASNEAARQEPNSCACSQRIAVYYFHRTERPETCISAELSIKDAIASGFPEQLKDGRLEWHSVNYEEPCNEHYAADYKITAPCLVLARMKLGTAVEWRSLPEVSELVGDKSKLTQLVQRNVQEFLDYIAIPGGCCT